MKRTKCSGRWARPFVVVRATLQLLGLSALCLPLAAHGADFTATISGDFRQMTIEGEIVSGDYEKFLKVMRDHQGKLSNIYLFTPGGDFKETMKIGRAIRALELSSMAPMRGRGGRPVCESNFPSEPAPRNPANCTCASAGFFLHVAAMHRGGTYLAVHRPYVDKKQFGALSEREAQEAFSALQKAARDYLDEMGVPAHVQEEVFRTPSEKALVLDERTVKSYFWGYLPYRHEWLRAKCGKFTPEERSRREFLLERMGSGLGKPLNGLTREEWDEYRSFDDREKAESSCIIETERKSRLGAYESFFGEKPTDYARHLFDRWTQAQGYLGRDFDQILGEERFDEDSSMSRSSLHRRQTAVSPSVLLFSSKYQPRVVSSVTVLSHSQPSPEFVDRLLRVLEDAWGKATQVDGRVGRTWRTPKVSATLKSSTAAGGEYLQLEIDEPWPPVSTPPTKGVTR